MNEGQKELEENFNLLINESENIVFVIEEYFDENQAAEIDRNLFDQLKAEFDNKVYACKMRFDDAYSKNNVETMKHTKNQAFIDIHNFIRQMDPEFKIISKVAPNTLQFISKIDEFIDHLQEFRENAGYDGVLYRYDYGDVEIILEEHINNNLDRFLDAYLKDNIEQMNIINFNVERLTDFESSFEYGDESSISSSVMSVSMLDYDEGRKSR